MDVFGEAFNVSSRDSINEASLTNTITANKTIFAAHYQLEVSVFNQVVSSNNNVDGYVDITLEVFALVVAHCWWRNILFLLVEFNYLPVHNELISSGLFGL